MMEKEMLETLNKAIEDFNKWDGAAMIYYNLKEKYCDTEVFINDVAASETYMQRGVFKLYEKSELDNTMNVGPKRKQFIVDMISFLDKGLDKDEAIYELMKTYPVTYLQ